MDDDLDGDWLTNDQTIGKVKSKTTYLGEHKVSLRSTSKNLLATEYYHIFMNNYNFLDLEEKYAQSGGSSGSTSLYLWKAFDTEEDE